MKPRNRSVVKLGAVFITMFALSIAIRYLLNMVAAWAGAAALALLLAELGLAIYGILAIGKIRESREKK